MVGIIASGPPQKKVSPGKAPEAPPELSSLVLPRGHALRERTLESGGAANAQSSAPVRGIPVSGAYTHAGVSDLSALTDCGILGYRSDTDQAEGIGASDCFNRAISVCRPAVISGVIDRLVTTYEVAGIENGGCVMMENYFEKVSDTQTIRDFSKCSIDPAKGWPSLTACREVR